MKIVKNRIGNACFLACLESFLYDHGIELTQEEMIKKLRPQNRSFEMCTSDGIVLVKDCIDVCDKSGVKFENIKCPTPIDSKYKDGSLLITLHGTQWHCVRYYGPLENSKFGVMDPNFNKGNDKEEFAIQDENYLIQNRCQFHRISLKLK